MIWLDILRVTSRDDNTSIRAIKSLGHSRSPRAVPALVKVISDPTRAPVLRSAAARALGQIGDTRAVDPLVAVIEPLENQSAGSVVESLLQIGPTAHSQLAALLHHPNRDFRWYVIQKLGKSSDKSFVDPLIELLEREKDHNILRVCAIALGELGDERARIPLQGLLSHNRDWLREAAQNAIKALDKGTKAVGPRCHDCDRDIGVEWSYSFENVVLTQPHGSQCRSCGLFFCSEHDHFDKDGNWSCPKCASRMVSLGVGSAYSSMVSQARIEGRYRGAIEEPSARGRRVVTE